MLLTEVIDKLTRLIKIYTLINFIEEDIGF
jgi:hypothetical protein